MDLELTHEQTLLTESVQQLLQQNPGPAAWPALIEFGALELAEIGAVELALVARELGARLEATPLIDSCAAAYAARGSSLALDEQTVGLALLEPGAGWSLEDPATTLGGHGVDGRKVVTGLAAVDALLVLADDGGSRRLALVPVDA